MTTMAQNEIDHILSNYASTILEEVRELKCRGRIQVYGRNLFTYIDIDNNFSYLPTDILAPHGFTLVPLMRKRFSPKSHISMMTNHEQDHIVEREDVNFTYDKWRDTDITFEIEDIQLDCHRDKNSGHMKIVCILIVSSPIIEAIRRDLGMRDNSDFYCCHIKVCEKLL
jgi:hypothetical protein